MKNKALIISLTIFLVLTTSCSIIGYVRHNNIEENNNKKPTISITYEYYLENLLVSKMPTNVGYDEEGNIITDDLYEFTNYQCSNGLTGTFDKESWSFNPDDEKSSICELYFVNAYYNVDITASNGTVDEKNDVKIKRESDGSFKVTPNEGYEFKEVNCTNNKQATYDKSTNTLNISVITEDVACKIDFEIKTLKMELEVKNGKGNTTESAKYGESISTVVEPNEGFENPKIECTNEQVATIENNKLSIEKITDDTKCTVTYVKTPEVKYLLKITVDEGATITVGNTEQNILAGKDAKFSIKPNEGYEVKLDCGGIKPSETTTDPDGTINYTFLKMSSNITCSITSTKINTEPTTDTGE